MVRVLIRGAGEHATGTAVRLWRAGFTIVMTELARPLAVRRTVAFSEAVYDGETSVEGVPARLLEAIVSMLSSASVNVVVDPECAILKAYAPEILIDARLMKLESDTSIDMAPLVIGLGPGFTAGGNCHAVIETNRGHNLGRVITSGSAEPNTGVPGNVGGETLKRVVRAPSDGVFETPHEIGDLVDIGHEVGMIAGRAIRAELRGVIRGLLRTGTEVAAGTKLGDIDPRCDPSHCSLLSDKTRTISGGVLEAILSWRSGRLGGTQ